MAAGVKFHCFAEDTLLGKHDFSSDTFKVALTNTAPSASNDAVLADITQITAENGYSSGGGAVANVAMDNTSGVVSISGDDVVFTASGGSFGPFRYAVLYNDTASGKPLIMYWDRGSSAAIDAPNTMRVDFGATIISSS